MTDPLFELYGTDEKRITGEHARHTVLLKKYVETFGCGAEGLFSAPGRTEIGGNHTDHNHGLVLAAAIDADQLAAAGINNSHFIRIHSNGFPDLNVDIRSLAENPAEKETSLALVKGICVYLMNKGYRLSGFDACIDGAVPVGSGLSSSAAFEVLIGTIINHLFNDAAIPPETIAVAGQWAENNYYGKPCGLMDQMASACGGMVFIDFKDPGSPIVKPLNFDFESTGYHLVITQTGGNHASLTTEYASIPHEMKSVAKACGSQFLSEMNLSDLLKNIQQLRVQTGDRAILRAIHFFKENERVLKLVEALESNDVKRFLKLINESGRSSFMYNQNIFSTQNPESQGISLALLFSDLLLSEYGGAFRIHGGGFAGTIQAFVPKEILREYIETMESVYGKGKCINLFIRPLGACQVNKPD